MRESDSGPVLTDFEERGLVRLPGAIPADDVAAMRERFWAFLAERGIDRDRPGTWPAGTPRRLQALRRSGAFAAMASPAVRAALDDLLGEWRSPPAWGLPLVTFPTPPPWRAPAAGWHVDSHGPDHRGVTVFAFLAPVVAGGGGTVVVEASHRLVARHIEKTAVWRPAEVRAALAAAHPWLRSAVTGDSPAGRTSVLDDVPVAVRELTGEPGDVVLMHPSTLHAAAPNTAATPRLMLVEIIQG